MGKAALTRNRVICLERLIVPILERKNLTNSFLENGFSDFLQLSSEARMIWTDTAVSSKGQKIASNLIESEQNFP